jgi:hypothetical protein
MTPRTGERSPGHSARPEEPNLKVYNASEIAEYYAALEYLTPCERLLFDAYLRPGMSILDLGVGGGRERNESPIVLPRKILEDSKLRRPWNEVALQIGTVGSVLYLPMGLAMESADQASLTRCCS